MDSSKGRVMSRDLGMAGWKMGERVNDLHEVFLYLGPKPEQASVPGEHSRHQPREEIKQG